MFKFICAADLHLDSPLHGLSRYEGAPVEELRTATRDALRNLVELAVGEEVKFVLISGDLFDGDWKDQHTGLFLVSQLKKLADAGIRVFAISGNHDADGNITRTLRLPPNATLLSTKASQTLLLEDLGVAIHGQGFARRDVTDNLSLRYPDAVRGVFNIGMLHTALTGAEGHELYAPCSLGDLQSKGYDVWALGHVHNRAVLCENPLILFPGNTQGRYARETGPKGCTLVTVEDGRVEAHEHRDLDVVQWEVVRVDASGLSSPSEVVDAVVGTLGGKVDEAGGSILAARIIVEGSCGAHRELVSAQEKWTDDVRAAVTGTMDSVWVEKVRFLTSSLADLGAIRTGTDPLSDLVRYVDGLSADEQSKALIAEDLALLKEKLPREGFTGQDAINYDDPKELARLVEDVKGMLVTGILSPGERR